MQLATDLAGYECDVFAFYSTEQLLHVISYLLTSIRDFDGEKVPSSWWEWLDSLQAMYERHKHTETSRGWLAGVCGMASAVFEMCGSKDVANLDNLVPLARGLARYGEAVQLVWDWMFHELGGGADARTA